MVLSVCVWGLVFDGWLKLDTSLFYAVYLSDTDSGSVFTGGSHLITAVVVVVALL